MYTNNDLTNGNLFEKMIKFAIPYIIAAFLQTFYGMVDLFVVGIYNDSSTTTAVSIASQVMHMLVVIILGFAMGTCVNLGKSVGAKDRAKAQKIIGTSIIFFMVLSVVLALGLFIFTDDIVAIMRTPLEALEETKSYLKICFIGIPFIIAYNVISSIFRGAGDSRHPMIFVFIACVVNIILDYVFVGYFKLGAKGAALATVLGQAVSVICALLIVKRVNLGFDINIKNIKLEIQSLKEVLNVGVPIALQDGFIQISFIVITIIANSRGLIDAAGVGIVEKIIGFMFLVPSAFLSAISAITAQNIGAGESKRAKKTLYYGLIITMSWGILCAIYNQFLPHTLIGLFTRDNQVLLAGCQYMKSYSLDTFLAAIHFCFSGYFCGIQKSQISFIHNIISIILVRIPGAYFASKIFAYSLYPMGLAAPMGSLVSAIICVVVYIHYCSNANKN